MVTGVALAALIGMSIVPSAEAARVDFAGPLVRVEADDGSGRYAGRGVGDFFFGHIDNQTFEGAISDGVTVTTFGCCINAGSFEVTNDVLLDFPAAGFLNQVLGSNAFSAGLAATIQPVKLGDSTPAFRITSQAKALPVGLSEG